MVAFKSLALSLAALAVSNAAPTAPAVEERGPMNFVMDIDHPLSKRFGNFTVREIGPRASANYVQNYKTGGSVNFNPSGNSFSLNWNTQQDFVVGVGWQPGSHK
jgi:endo-1,4-beta-xylanase